LVTRDPCRSDQGARTRRPGCRFGSADGRSPGSRSPFRSPSQDRGPSGVTDRDFRLQLRGQRRPWPPGRTGFPLRPACGTIGAHTLCHFAGAVNRAVPRSSHCQGRRSRQRFDSGWRGR
jgi:hypothetical protein